MEISSALAQNAIFLESGKYGCSWAKMELLAANQKMAIVTTTPKRKLAFGFSSLMRARMLSDQPYQFLNLPNMIGQPGLHGWCNPQSLVNPAVVVMHEVQGDVVGVVTAAIQR